MSPTKIVLRGKVSSRWSSIFLFKSMSINRSINNYFHRIRHYAGQVNYSAHGFVEKNNDRILRNISAAFYQSKLAIVQSLFPEGKCIRRYQGEFHGSILIEFQAIQIVLHVIHRAYHQQFACNCSRY